MKKPMAATFALVVAVSTRVAVAYEEPAYDVLHRNDDYELRAYPSYVVAEMTVDADVKGAGNAAFGALAGYIGGKNRTASEIPMTAPVTQMAAGKSRKIPMTAPVTQVRAENDGQIVQFIMPAGFTLASTPRPTDPRVRLREVPSRVIAARRYSGRWTLANLYENDRALRAALTRDGVAVTGPMEWARFDSPFRLWFMRRNEVWYPVDTGRSTQAQP